LVVLNEGEKANGLLGEPKVRAFKSVDSVVDPDPDRVGSASFCRIGIGIQGMLIRIQLIRIRPIRIGFN
jgi:hypothetical protein